MIAETSTSHVKTVQHFDVTKHKSSTTPKTPSWTCGAMHYSVDCSYKNHKCTPCTKKGHHWKCFKISNNSSKVEKHVSNQKCNYHKYKPKPKTTSIFVNVNTVQYCRTTKIHQRSDITLITKETWAKLGIPGTAVDDINVKSASRHGTQLIARFQWDTSITGQSIHSNIIYVSNKKNYKF